MRRLAGASLLQSCRPRRLLCVGRDPELHWPDGTPKKFRGREAWKNWIDWDSPHRALTDELNRARHYFWHVDTRGRLWRKELNEPERTFGQMRDARIVDFFLGHVQRNATGLYEDLYPYVSLRAHEHYFTSCERGGSPVVFNDLRDGELRHICPNGDLARSVTTALVPSRLRLADDGRLHHPVTTRATDAATGEPRREVLMALIESTTAQQLLECCEGGESAVDPGDVRLRWQGEVTPLLPLGDV